MQRAAGAAGEPGAVEEDAGVVDQAGHRRRRAVVARLAGPQEAAARRPRRGTASDRGRRRTKCLDDVGDVVLVDEVGAVAAAPLLHLGGAGVEDALAPVAVDAAVVRAQERGVEHPRALLVGVLEADPLVQVVGARVVAPWPPAQPYDGASNRPAPGRLDQHVWPPPPRTADELRQSFIDFFVARDHTSVPSASLIPHDPTLLFNVAGMVPFKPYFVGDEVPPFKRAVSSQKCVRAGGKHNDLDDVGRTKRHLVFFEMLGNFSFGDYFKELVIPASWELVTEVWGFDGDRIWITVHESDDEAEKIWHDVVGVPMERIQRLGDKDNFWQMGETGPCGPCSELHLDRGPAFGPDGGPLADPQGDRFMEFWNLVFMQYDQAPDGRR